MRHVPPGLRGASGTLTAVADLIPASPGDLTPQWLTRAMRAAGALPQGRVSSITVEPIGDGGTGFTGETVRVALATEGADDAPESVIAKFPTRDRQNRGMLEQFDAYAREIRFYRQFAHRLPCPTPAYLGGEYDGRARGFGPRASRLIDALPDAVQLAVTKDVTKFLRASKRRYVLLLEDLGPSTTVHDLAEPPDDAQLAAALETLAAVHAAFWFDDTLAGNDAFGPVLTMTPGLYRTVGLRRCLGLARERWDWFDDDDDAAVVDALERFADDVDTVNRPVTLIHGDPRSDNLLYRDDGDVVLLDWALAAYANPAFDVGYLLSSCLSADRIAAADELVDGYIDALAERGVTADRARLRADIGATYRGLAVQQLMSIPVLRGESYGDDTIFDIWMPRILAGMAHEW